MFVIILSISIGCLAQTMSITEFYLDENDLTANTAGTIVFDQNGNKCALIKIETTEFGFSFDVGSLGVVKTEQHTGEIWVYIPEGVKRISISHPRLEKIRDFDLGLSVKRARTYIMKLHILNPTSHIGGLGTVDVKVQPDGAEVFIDNISVGKAPLSFNRLIPGKHKITIKKEGYYDFESDVNIAEDKVAIIDETLAKSCEITRLPDKILISTKGITFCLIKIEGGTFQMGGTKEQKGAARTDEFPVHLVTLSDYYIGETEVTNELWTTIMGESPAIYFAKPDQPVNNVSWYDCQRFISRLSSLTGIRFCLPTEAQWEFAARGGKNSMHYKYSGSNNLKKVGWFKGNSKNTIKEVKTLDPNELGLYDMSGNVYEWCSDWYGLYTSDEKIDPKGTDIGTRKVNRGSSGGEKKSLHRVSCRFSDDPNSKFQSLGLRLAIIE